VSKPIIVGRSSSHFTRVVRIFAHECELSYDLQVVAGLMDTSPQAFGGNPGLKLPNLLVDGDVVFGALNSSKVVAELGHARPRIVWPEQVSTRLAANAQEVLAQAMTTEVIWLMSNAAGAGESSYANKLKASLAGALNWLDVHLERVIDELPVRDASYLEVCLFCLAEHVEFRQVMSLEGLPALMQFRRQWAQRDSSQLTSFRFDAVA
jgi:glutathione S-transferase